MLVTVLAKARNGHCSTCAFETSVWVCLYDRVPNRGGINHLEFCDDDLPSELEYVARLGVAITDERGEQSLELRELLAAAYAAAASRAVEPPPLQVLPVKHECHRPGCTVEVPPRLLACRPHWYQLQRGAPDVAAAILATYRPGQEITKTPSAEYREAARLANDYWVSLDTIAAALTTDEEEEG